jgi:cell division protein ZipA
MDFLAPTDILIIIASLALLAVILDIARRLKKSRYENLQMSSRHLKKTASDLDNFEEDDFDQSQFPSGGSKIIGSRDVEEPVNLETSHAQFTAENNFGFNKPEQQDFDLDNAGFKSQNHQEAEGLMSQSSLTNASRIKMPESQEVLVIHLVANKGAMVNGADLLAAAVDSGLRYGEMKIFHRHLNSDGSGPILFSMANLVNPGTFDLNTMNSIDTPGVTFFMALDDVEDTVSGFDNMLNTVDKLTQSLPLNIMDETRSSMTRQTIDHYRQRAKKVFSQRLAKN